MELKNSNGLCQNIGFKMKRNDKNEIKNLQQINTFTKYTYNWKCYHCNYSWSQSPNSLLQKFRNVKNRIAIICCRECKKDLKIKFK